MNKKKIGELLKEAQLISDEDLRRALEEQKKTGERLGSALVRLKLVDAEMLARILAEQQKVEAVDLSEVKPQWEAVQLLTRKEALQWGCLPLTIEGESLRLALLDPRDEEVIQQVEEKTGKKVLPCIAPQSLLYEAIQQYYPLLDPQAKVKLQKLLQSLQELIRELNDLLSQ